MGTSTDVGPCWPSRPPFPLQLCRGGSEGVGCLFSITQHRENEDEGEIGDVFAGDHTMEGGGFPAVAPEASLHNTCHFSAFGFFLSLIFCNN